MVDTPASPKLSVDLAACTGCRACSLACVLGREQVVSLSLTRIRVDKKFPGLEPPVFAPTYCRMCDDAPCIDSCPSGALNRDDAGATVILDATLCSGCGNCVEACPHDAIWMVDALGTVLKCDWCNGDPICVHFCAPGALKFE